MNPITKTNLINLNKLEKIRKKIYGVCKACRCSKLQNCRKRQKICNDNEMHTKLRSNGAPLVQYYKARNNILVDNIPFVIKKASSMGYKKEYLEDLIQEGIIGLNNAIDYFDLEKSENFMTYAYQHVRKNLCLFAKRNNLVRKSGHLKELLNRSIRIYDRMVQDRVSNVSVVDIMSRLKKERSDLPKSKEGMLWIESELNKIITYRHRNAININELSSKFINYNENELNDFYERLQDELDKNLDKLGLELSEIIRMKFGVGPYDRPLSYEEIAIATGLNSKSVEKKINRFFRKRSR